MYKYNHEADPQTLSPDTVDSLCCCTDTSAKGLVGGLAAQLLKLLVARLKGG
jgi:hypothetical protein